MLPAVPYDNIWIYVTQFIPIRSNGSTKQQKAVLDLTRNRFKNLGVSFSTVIRGRQRAVVRKMAMSDFVNPLSKDPGDRLTINRLIRENKEILGFLK